MLETQAPIQAAAKFFSRAGTKFFFKAMRLELPQGAADFASKIELRQRLSALSEGHTTGLVLNSEQAFSGGDRSPVLGLAASASLKLLIEFAVAYEELVERSQFRALRSRVAAQVNQLRLSPAVMGYLLDCAVTGDRLRADGVERVRRRLARLLGIIRRADPDRLVAISHRPSTIALSLLEEDFIYVRLPELAPSELSAYAVKLHNLAEARPLVLEFSAGLPGQDELVACAFGLGAAGVVAPVMRPVASSGWLGLRTLSAGELLPFVTLNGACPPQPAAPPMVSVVICAYNAERTMRPCLESLRKLDYPNFEVVIVDDGSRDTTAAIAMDFPEFRLIRQTNKGLSVARNVGMRAARGELIAYTDSDCVVDPHWLTLMVRAMREQGFDGCGGPNYAPHEEGWIEACCAASPGAPCHVLTGDDRAEHLAGCNMVYRKAALEAIGGFDPQFTAAGDDVDICWRLLDAGFALGFCPAAFVWHFRRNTIRAYYGQQRGYGKAEAMLFLKYPERFNALGQISWRGTIPGLARTIPGGDRRRIGWVRKPHALPTIAEKPLSILQVLPLTAEWDAAVIGLAALCWTAGIMLWPCLLLLTLGPLWAIYYAARAPLERGHRGIVARTLIAYLALTGPIVRTLARYRYRKSAAAAAGPDAPPRQRATLDLADRALRLTYWNEVWTTRDQLLERIAQRFAQSGRPALPGSGWTDADLVLEPGALTQTRIKTADEEHSGNRIKTHVAVRARLLWTSRIGLLGSLIAAVAALVLGAPEIAIACAMGAVALAVCALTELGGSMGRAYRIVEQAAAELSLLPLGKVSAPARQPALRADQAEGVSPGR